MSKKKKLRNPQLRFVAVFSEVRKVFIPIKAASKDDLTSKGKGFVRIFVDLSILKEGKVPGLDGIQWHFHESATMHKHNGAFRFIKRAFGKHNDDDSLTEDAYTDQFKDPATLAGILIAIDDAKELFVSKAERAAAAEAAKTKGKVRK